MTSRSTGDIFGMDPAFVWAIEQEGTLGITCPYITWDEGRAAAVNPGEICYLLIFALMNSLHHVPGFRCGTFPRMG